jgi:pimeloyl-ACP methyl ester carboxylesterase
MRKRIEKRFNRKWDQYSIEKLAPTINAPLLVIHDRDDRETLITEGVAVAAAWPDAQMIATEGLGHRRILRDPSVVDSAAGFIAGEN